MVRVLIAPGPARPTALCIPQSSSCVSNNSPQPGSARISDILYCPAINRAHWRCHIVFHDLPHCQCMVDHWQGSPSEVTVTTPTAPIPSAELRWYYVRDPVVTEE